VCVINILSGNWGVTVGELGVANTCQLEPRKQGSQEASPTSFVAT